MPDLVMANRAKPVHTTRVPSGITVMQQISPPSEVRLSEVTFASRPEGCARLGSRELAMLMWC